MKSKKKKALILALLILPIFSLNPLFYSLPKILQWDLPLIALAYLSLGEKKYGFIYCLYLGLVFDAMISPVVGFFILYFSIIFMGLYSLRRFLAIHSPVSIFLTILLFKLLSLPLLSFLSFLFHLGLLPYSIDSFLLPLVSSGLAGALFFYFFIPEDRLYPYER